MITPRIIPASDGPADEALRARIVRRLERFGPGPAASFRDACVLMDGESPVASDAYLVGHLVRELEGSVRAVLLPRAAGPPQEREPAQEERQPAPEERQPAPEERQPAPEERQPAPDARKPPEARKPASAERQPVTPGVLGRLVLALKALIQAVFRPSAPQSPRPSATQPPRSADATAAVASAAEAQLAQVRAEVEVHRAQIRAVLDSLEIAYDSDAGQTWLGYAGLLPRREPGRGLGLPRPVEQEFRRHFADFEAMLDVVLGRHEARYLTIVAGLDALAQVEHPTDEHASELRRTLPPDPVAMEHFFSQLASPTWIGPLCEQGFFAEPPAPVAGGEGSRWLRHWPALRYLVRVASQDPGLAVRVAIGIPMTTNQLVNADFVDLALEIPAADGARLLPRIAQDLAGPYEAVRAERYGALIVHLVDGGMPGAALDLARVLWGFAPSPADQDTVPDVTGDLRRRIDSDSYAETLRGCLPPLVAGGGLDVLAAMVGLLDDAITETSNPAMIESRQDLSALWCPAVEDWPRNRDSGAKAALVGAVRDAAEQLVLDRQVELADVLLCLDARQWPIFRRLALHLVRRFGAGYPEEVARRLTDPATIKDPFTEREFLLLAGDGFVRLNAEQQQHLLTLIDQGPDADAWAAGYATRAGREPAKDQIARWIAEWTRDRLGALEPALPQQRRDLYTKLVRLVGEPVPARKTRAASRFLTDFISPPGGRGPAAFRGADADGVVDYLRAQPSNGANVVRLAQELGDAVRASPLRYSAVADRFSGLPEPYVAGLLEGLHAAFSNGADLDWNPILWLCEWVSGKVAAGEVMAGESVTREPVAGEPVAGEPVAGEPVAGEPVAGQAVAGEPVAGQAIAGDPLAGEPVAGDPLTSEPQSASGRREMILLLRAGLDRMPPVIPIAERDHVWQVIAATLSGNAPAAGDGSIAAGEARARARAEALAAAVSYGGWIRCHDREADLAPIFGVLDQHLDPDAEPSLLVRAVYGTEFGRLAGLDGTWTAATASRIFPAGDTGRERWDAAWDAYLDSSPAVSRDVCALLTDQYRLAVDRLAAGGGEPAELRDVRLGHHLITRFWSGDITLDSGDHLIERFYLRASASVREQMTRYIGWNLLDPRVGTDQAVLSRLTRLWEERLAVASPSADRGELVRFGEWFASGRFDDDWSLRQLGRVITLTGDIKPDILVLRRLAEIAPARAEVCLDIVGEWIKQLPADAWLFSAREEYLRRILEVGLASPDAITRALAGDILGRAERPGRKRFQGLYHLAAAESTRLTAAVEGSAWHAS